MSEFMLDERIKKAKETQTESPTTDVSHDSTPTVSPISSIQRMQATHGNSYVRRLLAHGIQPKLNVTPAHDAYEAEADKMAEMAVSRMAMQRETGIQREAAPEEEEPIQAMRIQREAAPEEEEPIQAMRIQREAAPEEEEPIQAMRIQREAAPEEEEPIQAMRIQRSGIAYENGGTVSPEVEEGIKSARGGGTPLPDGVGEQLGQAMGADFSGVRVHTDSKADHLSRSVSAKAFTTGGDIFFRSGAYNPASQDGQRLLAHELTHTIQQGASAQRKPDDAQ